MRLIEVFLRLACSLVGWMVIYAHCVWTATLRVTGCSADGDHLWALLLGFAPVTVGFAFVIGVSRPLGDVHRTLALLGVPLLLFVPLAAVAVWPWFVAATLGGEGICAPTDANGWHAWWAPVQFAVLGIIVAVAIRIWRQRGNPSAS